MSAEHFSNLLMSFSAETLVLIVIISGASATFVTWGYRMILREGKLIWLCDRVELTVRSCEIVPTRFGYRLEVEHEYREGDGCWVSKSTGPTGYPFTLHRSVAEKIKAELGRTVKGYFDTRAKQTYFTGRHYDIIDKVFSPLFILGTAILSLSFWILCTASLLQLWRELVAI